MTGKEERTHLMYSLNQVNKLVSCGRDPARSLAFMARVRFSSRSFGGYASRKIQRNGLNDASKPHHRYFDTAVWLDGAPCRHDWQSENWAWVGVRSSTPSADFNTGVGAVTLVLNNCRCEHGRWRCCPDTHYSGTRNTAVGGHAMVMTTARIIQRRCRRFCVE